jgi:hypothetical protein
LDILKDAAKPNLQVEYWPRQSSNLYKTILDTVARDKMGIKPLLPF